jgi:hypothetical protein
MSTGPESVGFCSTILRMWSKSVNSGSWNGNGLRTLIDGLCFEEYQMKKTIIALSSMAFFLSASAVFAQGVSSKTPGHEMQKKGSKKGSPGASGYAPGQEMQAKGSKKGEPGASGYAPGKTVGSDSKAK